MERSHHSFHAAPPPPPQQTDQRGSVGRALGRVRGLSARRAVAAGGGAVLQAPAGVGDAHAGHHLTDKCDGGTKRNETKNCITDSSLGHRMMEKEKEASEKGISTYLYGPFIFVE